VKNIRLILNVGIAIDPKNNSQPYISLQKKTPKVMCSMLQLAPLLLGHFHLMLLPNALVILVAWLVGHFDFMLHSHI